MRTSEQERIAAAYTEHRDVLRRLAAVVTGDARCADDLVQDAYAELSARSGSVEDPAGWLRRVVTRRAIDWGRRQGSARAYLVRYGREVTHLRPTEQLADRLAVRDALARLSPEHRAVVFARYYLDLPEREIATMLGVRPGTVKSRLSRALAALEEDLT
ncbi:MAG: sigma-70 family RNA polymerase sigma factor [Mobilicoccus sp.]|nr:sigma-70 family RNA polymerase sigma factor [Mobilicoccus sp.]